MNKAFIILIVFVLMFPFKSFSQKEKEGKTGINAGIGMIWIANQDFDDYYKNKANVGFHMMTFHGFNASKIDHTLYVELNIKSSSSIYKFNNIYNGIVTQSKMGVNFAGNLFSNSKTSPIELIVGPGIYTLWQERDPDPLSGLSKINDGFGAYWGVVFNFGLSYTIPIGSKYFGMSYRVFWYPKLTFFNRDNVPEFYSTGTSITIQYSFND